MRVVYYVNDPNLRRSTPWESRSVARSIAGAVCGAWVSCSPHAWHARSTNSLGVCAMVSALLGAFVLMFAMCTYLG